MSSRQPTNIVIDLTDSPSPPPLQERAGTNNKERANTQPPSLPQGQENQNTEPTLREHGLGDKIGLAGTQQNTPQKLKKQHAQDDLASNEGTETKEEKPGALLSPPTKKVHLQREARVEMFLKEHFPIPDNVKKIETILHVRKTRPKGDLKCYVKYYNRSYRFCEWIPKESILDERLLVEIKKRLDINFLARNYTELYNPEYIIPESIIAKKGKMYLVKWNGLSYGQSTWEISNESMPRLERLITRYETLEKERVSGVQPNENQNVAIDDIMYRIVGKRNFVLSIETVPKVETILNTLSAFQDVKQLNTGEKRKFLVLTHSLDSAKIWEQIALEKTWLNCVLYHGSDYDLKIIKELLLFTAADSTDLEEAPFDLLVMTQKTFIENLACFSGVKWGCVIIDNALMYSIDQFCDQLFTVLNAKVVEADSFGIMVDLGSNFVKTAEANKSCVKFMLLDDNDKESLSSMLILPKPIECNHINIAISKYTDIQLAMLKEIYRLRDNFSTEELIREMEKCTICPFILDRSVELNDIDLIDSSGTLSSFKLIFDIIDKTQPGPIAVFSKYKFIHVILMRFLKERKIAARMITAYEAPEVAKSLSNQGIVLLCNTSGVALNPFKDFNLKAAIFFDVPSPFSDMFCFTNKNIAIWYVLLQDSYSKRMYDHLKSHFGHLFVTMNAFFSVDHSNFTEKEIDYMYLKSILCYTTYIFFIHITYFRIGKEMLEEKSPPKTDANESNQDNSAPKSPSNNAISVEMRSDLAVSNEVHKNEPNVISKEKQQATEPPKEEPNTGPTKETPQIHPNTEPPKTQPTPGNLNAEKAQPLKTQQKSPIVQPPEPSKSIFNTVIANFGSYIHLPSLEEIVPRTKALYIEKVKKTLNKQPRKPIQIETQQPDQQTSTETVAIPTEEIATPNEEEVIPTEETDTPNDSDSELPSESESPIRIDQSFYVGNESTDIIKPKELREYLVNFGWGRFGYIKTKYSISETKQNLELGSVEILLHALNKIGTDVDLYVSRLFQGSNMKCGMSPSLIGEYYKEHFDAIKKCKAIGDYFKSYAQTRIFLNYLFIATKLHGVATNKTIDCHPKFKVPWWNAQTYSAAIKEINKKGLGVFDKIIEQPEYTDPKRIGETSRIDSMRVLGSIAIEQAKGGSWKWTRDSFKVIIDYIKHSGLRKYSKDKTYYAMSAIIDTHLIGIVSTEMVINLIDKTIVTGEPNSDLEAINGSDHVNNGLVEDRYLLKLLEFMEFYSNVKKLCEEPLRFKRFTEKLSYPLKDFDWWNDSKYDIFALCYIAKSGFLRLTWHSCTKPSSPFFEKSNLKTKVSKSFSWELYSNFFKLKLFPGVCRLYKRYKTAFSSLNDEESFGDIIFAKKPEDAPPEPDSVVIDRLNRNKQGLVTFPIYGSFDFAVERIGKIEIGNERYHSENYVFPVGYRSVRLITNNFMEMKRFVCTIERGKDGPEFVVDGDDCKYSGNTPTEPWRDALCRCGFDSSLITEQAGYELFGLNNPSITYLIQRLPYVCTCTGYKQKKIVEEPEIS